MSARSERGSTAPVSVVPAVAAISQGKRPAFASPSIAFSRASGPMRCWPSRGTKRLTDSLSPAMRNALSIAWWVCSLRYTTALPKSFAFRPRASLAVTIPTRLAMLPPLVRSPAAYAGYPMKSAIHLKSTRSMRTAPGEAKYNPEYRLMTAAR